jgi:hypothetical protein
MVKGLPMTRLSTANSASAMLLSSPAHTSSQSITWSGAQSPRAASATKKAAPNTSSACTGTPRRQPIHSVSRVSPSAAEAASSNRPGPDTTANNTQGAMPASGVLT